MQCMNTPDKKSRLIVITGPSGVGKGSLIGKLLERNKSIWLSVSATTRSPRFGEVNGKNYFFLEREEFVHLINSGGLLEWAEFAGNFYGTPKEKVEAKLQKGISVLLEIEVEGARQVRKTFPNSLQIFISPPSLQELEKRIKGRASDSEDAIQRRLIIARKELKNQQEFDFVIVNDDFEEALTKLEECIEIKAK